MTTTTTTTCTSCTSCIIGFGGACDLHLLRLWKPGVSEGCASASSSGVLVLLAGVSTLPRRPADRGLYGPPVASARWGFGAIGARKEPEGPITGIIGRSCALKLGGNCPLLE